MAKTKSGLDILAWDGKRLLMSPDAMKEATELAKASDVFKAGMKSLVARRTGAKKANAIKRSKTVKLCASIEREWKNEVAKGNHKVEQIATTVAVKVGCELSTVYKYRKLIPSIRNLPAKPSKNSSPRR